MIIAAPSHHSIGSAGGVGVSALGKPNTSSAVLPT